MYKHSKKPFSVAIALSLGLSLSACGGIAGVEQNRSLNSVKQPVVEKSNYTMDVRTGMGGLSIPEQGRLSNWFESMDLGYGDKVYLEDASASPATREAVSQLAERHGVLLSQGAPVTAGYVNPGMARVVLSRSSAFVPGCPDWSHNRNGNYGNATTPDFGCSVNGNMAAMIADPEHLINGAEGTGETVVSTSTKAIESYRTQAPTGQGGLKAADTGGGE